MSQDITTITNYMKQEGSLMKEETAKWMKSAKLDLDSAKKNCTMGIFHVSSFLSQQAAEKALKALIIEKTGEFPRIHDLKQLSLSLKCPKNIIDICIRLNPAYTMTRYPDVAIDISRKESKDLLEGAETVLKWIEKQLK